MAVLAVAGTPEDTARAGLEGLAPPPELALVLDPDPAQVLAGAVRLLQAARLHPDPRLRPTHGPSSCGWHGPPGRTSWPSGSRPSTWTTSDGACSSAWRRSGGASLQ